MSKKGSIRLLQRKDFEKQSHFGGPLVSWKPTSQGEGGLYNPRGFSCLRVVLTKEVDEEQVGLYDQVMLVEDPGAIIVCTAGEKVGFVQSFRMVGERLPIGEDKYVSGLNKRALWGELLSFLGQDKWELPRGIAPVSGTDPIQSALAIAKQEALEEAGWQMKSAEVIGKINTNPTFFAHSQYVVRGFLEAQQEQAPEDLEIIGNVKFFTPTEIRDEVTAGTINDGLSLSALAIAGISF